MQTEKKAIFTAFSAQIVLLYRGISLWDQTWDQFETVYKTEYETVYEEKCETNYEDHGKYTLVSSLFDATGQCNA